MGMCGRSTRIQLGFEVVTHLITGKTPLKIKEVISVRSFASHQHFVDQTDKTKEPREASLQVNLGALFRDALHAREASAPSSHPLAAMFDSTSDTHPEHGLSLEKLQHLILSL